MESLCLAQVCKYAAAAELIAVDRELMVLFNVLFCILQRILALSVAAVSY